MRKRKKPSVQPDPDVAGGVPDAAGDITPAKKRSWDWHLIIGKSGEHGKVHKRWLTGVFASAVRYGVQVERLDSDHAEEIAAEVTYGLHLERKKEDTILDGSVDGQGMLSMNQAGTTFTATVTVEQTSVLLPGSHGRFTTPA
jgi:hypothetical protein